MPLIPIIVVVGLVILVMYFVLNKKEVEQVREGLVKDILSKDAIAVEFEIGTVTVVKFFGITMAAEVEMLDDKIMSFFDEHLRGYRVTVNPKSVGAGNVVVGEVRTLANEYVNAVLVRHGFARWSPAEASNDSELFDAQDKAKTEQLGVWNPAVRQLAEDKLRSQSIGEMSDEDIANQNVDPDDLETKSSDS